MFWVVNFISVAVQVFNHAGLVLKIDHLHATILLVFDVVFILHLQYRI